MRRFAAFSFIYFRFNVWMSGGTLKDMSDECFGGTPPIVVAAHYNHLHIVEYVSFAVDMAVWLPHVAAYFNLAVSMLVYSLSPKLLGTPSGTR